MARPRCRHVCVSGLLPFIMVAALIKLLGNETEIIFSAWSPRLSI